MLCRVRCNRAERWFKCHKFFTEELKRKSVELYFARDKDKAVADELGIGRSTLQKWERNYGNELNPVLTNETEEFRRLRRGNARLAEENATLKAGCVLRSGCATKAMRLAFIDEERNNFPSGRCAASLKSRDKAITLGKADPPVIMTCVMRSLPKRSSVSIDCAGACMGRFEFTRFSLAKENASRKSALRALWLNTDCVACPSEPSPSKRNRSLSAGMSMTLQDGTSQRASQMNLVRGYSLRQNVSRLAVSRRGLRCPLAHDCRLGYG
ncbi:transposase [Eggerthellaceae bacterium zg-887]|nr:transposase [Xiamenia xianingshaonis]